MKIRGFFYLCLAFDTRFFQIFIKFIGVGADLMRGVCCWDWRSIVGIKYYRIAESRWGIVFMVRRLSCCHKGGWGYGGVDRCSYLGCQGY